MALPNNIENMMAEGSMVVLLCDSFTKQDIKRILTIAHESDTVWKWKPKYMPTLFVLVKKDCDSDEED